MSVKLLAGARNQQDKYDRHSHYGARAGNLGRFSMAVIHLLAAIILAGWVTSALAADRVFLGNVQSFSLAASTDPDTVQTLNGLRQQAAATGTARLILGVRAAFAPEGLMSAGNALQQRKEIANMQSVVLDRVSSLRLKPQKTKRFTNIPFMAVEADPAELETLASLPEVTSIEEDRLLVPTLAESVPLIGGTAAWASGYTGNGQTIAILDTGVDKTHPFLAGKVVSEACYSTNGYGSTSICPGGVESSTATGSAMPYDGNCPAGECDHGTHVAGISAGKGGGTTGVTFSGVAKDASLIAIQIFSRFDSTSDCGVGYAPCAMSWTSDEILALQRVYALRNTYSIAAVNMSLGGGQYFSQSTCDSQNSSTKAAIQNLLSVNIATVIASGNDGYTNSLSAPGCISNAISVGATYDSGTNVDRVTSYSNSASFLDLLAPGSYITSSIPGGGYATWQGTSMATPHVAGAWAILKQKNPNLTVSDGISALSSTGIPIIDPRNGIVKPRIQIDSALDALPTFSVPVCSAISPPSQSVAVNAAPSPMTATCSNSPTSYVWQVDGITDFSASGATYTIPGFATAIGSPHTVTVTANNASGSGTVAATATVTVTSQTTSLTPVCTLTASPGTINPGGFSTLTATCSPAATRYAWTNTPWVGIRGAAKTTGGTVTPKATTTYTVTGSNSYGAGNTASATVTVGAGVPAVPACSAISPPSQSVAVNAASSPMTATCSNNPTSYVWQVDGITDFSASGATYTIPGFATAIGSPHTVTVTANNASGSGTVAAKATVTVTSQATSLTPVCTLTASPGTINPGGFSTLTATCSPAATRYAWTNTPWVGIRGAAKTTGGTVTPKATTTYTVTGSNSYGVGNTASATVAVSSP